MKRLMVICLVILIGALCASSAVAGTPDFYWSEEEAVFLVEHYAANADLGILELRKVPRVILSSKTADFETRAWAWAMAIEYCTRKNLGSEQFARWGLAMTMPLIPIETFEAIEKRLKRTARY